MRKIKKRVLYVFAALLAVVFVLACLAGFSACGGGSNDDENEATVSSVSISGGKSSMNVGDTATLTASVTMSDGGNYSGSYAWSTSDSSVVSLSGTTASSVTATAMAAGNATITLSVDNNKNATCSVTVAATVVPEPEVTVKSVSVSPETLALKMDGTATGTITATVTMSDDKTSDSQSVTWKSSDTSVATVSETGYTATVTAVGAGTADITASVGSVASTNKCTVTVEAATVEPEPTPEPEVEIDTEEALIEALEEGGEIALADDIAITDALEISEDTELDLAGYTLSTGEDWETAAANSTNNVLSDAMITVSAGVELTIKDTSDEETGKIDYAYEGETRQVNWGGGTTYTTYNWNSAGNHGAAILLDGTDSSVTIESGEITSSSVGIRAKNGSVVINDGVIYSSAYYVIWEDVGQADVTINGGLVAGAWGGILVDGDSNYKGGFGTNAVTTLTVNGGVVYSGGTNQGAIRTENYTSTNSAIITITGGQIICADNGGAESGTDEKTVKNEAAIFIGNGTLNILGGEITGPTAVEVQGGKTDISGGTLKASYTGEQNVTPVSSSDPFTYGYALSIYPRVMSARSDNPSFTSATDVSVSGGSFTGSIYVSATAYKAPSGEEWGLNEADSDGNTNYKFHISASLGMVQSPLTDESGEVVAYLYSKDIVSVPSGSFTFNGETFRGMSGLTEDFTGGTTGTQYTAGDISITETVGSDGTICVVVDGIVANMMNSAQKAAFSSEISEDDTQIRFYIAVQIAVQPGETVTVTSSNGKTDTIYNDTDEVRYSLWLIQVNSDGYSSGNAPTKDYAVVTMGITFSVTVTDAKSNSSNYTVSFGNIFLPKAAWNCASGQHTVSQWTVVEEETCGMAGSQTGICDICGEEVTETIEATGNHSWNDGEVTTPATCTTEGVLTKTCTVCGATKTEVIPATGHTATEYDDGKIYAEYKSLNEEDESAEYSWCAYCETCEEWFEIEGEYSEYSVYDFVLVAKDEASLDAAIATAKERTDGSEEVRTQILVYGTIEISDTSYVLIDCDNVEIYGLGTEQSKIVDSVYDSGSTNNPQSGVEISGKNVTIRNLAIDGTALNNVDGSDTHNYKHALELKGGAENVTISGCVITGGGTATNDSSICIMNGTGTVKIENCTLSGAATGLVIEYNGQSIDIEVSGGKIDAIRPIWIDGGGGVTLNVEGTELYGRSELGPYATEITFTDCTFGYHIDGETAYGSVDVYGVITFKNCKFLSHTEGTDKDSILKESGNYVIGAYYNDVTIYLIGCTFENTYSELVVEGAVDSMVTVDKDTFIYIVGGGNDIYSCSLYFDDSENATQYIYDATSHTVTEYVDVGPDDQNP